MSNAADVPKCHFHDTQPLLATLCNLNITTLYKTTVSLCKTKCNLREKYSMRIIFKFVGKKATHKNKKYVHHLFAITLFLTNRFKVIAIKKINHKKNISTMLCTIAY